MGNCFGKPSSSDQNFSGEGRTLGASAARPAGTGATSAKISAPQAGRTLGANPVAATAGGQLSPGEAARRAAEVRTSTSSLKKGGVKMQKPRVAGQAAPRMDRLNSSRTQNSGKLGKQLSAQKAQTQTETLAQTAKENLARREADQAGVVRSYN
ncbi:hypothetical protein B0A48_02910 [Cryoendolithus antarcticus]|uniref:Uncharacterized protein n=1 Tax=Cryoendolithus antarcticus TaxID=1507870 RepID=A0A1V8TLL3_9PEZI|nr:hypothetical protein B0A48_02910 [Cryoendolithus antarcticus]